MDGHNDNSRDCRSREGGPGLIEKAAHLAPQEVTTEELKAINKYALVPLKAEDVFTFKAVLCDNEVDRTYERFSMKALQDLKKLFQGKPVIKDHRPRADNQVARIYSTELVQTGKTTAEGELYTQLVAHCYMVKTAGNADLIAEIMGGIKREGSVGCAVSRSICSVCGTDNNKSYCSHYPGRQYAKQGGTVTCTFMLDGGADAYEFSLVVVPAQKQAGTCKSYTGELVYEGKDPATKFINPADQAARTALRARLAARTAANNTIKEEIE